MTEKKIEIDLAVCFYRIPAGANIIKLFLCNNKF